MASHGYSVRIDRTDYVSVTLICDGELVVLDAGPAKVTMNVSHAKEIRDRLNELLAEDEPCK